MLEHAANERVTESDFTQTKKTDMDSQDVSEGERKEKQDRRDTDAIAVRQV